MSTRLQSFIEMMNKEKKTGKLSLQNIQYYKGSYGVWIVLQNGSPDRSGNPAQSGAGTTYAALEFAVRNFIADGGLEWQFTWESGIGTNGPHELFFKEVWASNQQLAKFPPDPPHVKNFPPPPRRSDTEDDRAQAAYIQGTSRQAASGSRSQSPQVASGYQGYQQPASGQAASGYQAQYPQPAARQYGQSVQASYGGYQSHYGKAAPAQSGQPPAPAVPRTPEEWNQHWLANFGAPPEPAQRVEYRYPQASDFSGPDYSGSIPSQHQDRSRGGSKDAMPPPPAPKK